MIDGSHLKWDDLAFGTAVRLSNNVDDDNEQCEKSLKVDTPESVESLLIVEIVSSQVSYQGKMAHRCSTRLKEHLHRALVSNQGVSDDRQRSESSRLH